MTGKQALIGLAKDIKYSNIDTAIQFGAEILLDLASQQAIVGSVKFN